MKKLSLFFLLMPALLQGACAQQDPPVISVRTVIDSIFIPWEIIYGPDNHIWMTQKNGYVCRLNPDNGELDTLYHATDNVIQSEGGMLGMALHPGFPQQPYVFVAYEYLSGNDYRERVIRLTYNGATLGQDTIIFDGIVGAVNHNGCRLLIVDHKLFITTGDALNTSNSQDLSSLNGKILRLNLDGSVPADNPVPGSPLWTWGHRNPQGLVFHNGILYSSEHGPDDNDEINIIQKGRNYGWPEVHGFCDEPSEMQFCADSGVKEPIFAWTPTIAPSGMDFYDAAMFPQLQHSLLLATLKDEHLYRLQLSAGGDSIINVTTLPEVNAGRLRDVCISPDGRIFVSTSNSATDGSEHKDKIIELYDSSATGIRPVKNKHALILYPNPAGDVLYLAWEPAITPGRIDYLILNALGQKIEEGNVTGQMAISVSGLAPGIYFLRLSNGYAASFRKQQH